MVAEETPKRISMYMADLLVFELGPDPDELFIHGDAAGLRRLATLLNTLAVRADAGDFPHDHLFTTQWGGSELASEVQEPSHVCLHHVKVYAWPTAEGAAPYNSKNPK